jgi:hypothetical protein
MTTFGAVRGRARMPLAAPWQRSCWLAAWQRRCVRALACSVERVAHPAGWRSAQPGNPAALGFWAATCRPFLPPPGPTRRCRSAPSTCTACCRTARLCCFSQVGGWGVGGALAAPAGAAPARPAAGPVANSFFVFPLLALTPLRCSLPPCPAPLQ